MPKKKPIIETHGKVESVASKPTPSSLEQVWGSNNDLSRYGTLDEAVYQTRVNDMTRADLETEARRRNIFIPLETLRLREMLMKEFRAFAASLNKPDAPLANIAVKPDLKAAAAKILAEGR